MTSWPAPSILRHKLQVRPTNPGPYLAPKTGEDAADASDAGVGVLDVLEAGNFTQNVVQTHADVGSTSPAGHGLVLVLKVSQKSPQKSFFVVAPTKSALTIICAF